jgi:two-component system chemotaxis response regulator CheY
MNILVVDDSRVTRSIVQRTLRQAGFKGHDIVEAENGRAALDKISESPPDLVLSDWNMPEMLGIDLLRSLREKGNEVPFVFITSETTEDMHATALNEGAAAIITKPFNADKFEATLSGVIQ